MIKRIGDYKSGIPFYYVYSKNNVKVSDQNVLSWIKELCIPPAYNSVVINEKKTAKILAFGYDSKGRKQYIYNPKFVEKRARDKYNKIIELNEVFQRILDDINRDLESKDEKTRDIAIIIYLIIFCGFRVGNKTYEKNNGSYGISTIKYKHLKFAKGVVTIDFIGKKGVQNVSQCDNVVVFKTLLKKKKALKAEDFGEMEVFSGVSSIDVNDYLKKFHQDITSKDLRTWNANTMFISFVKQAILTGDKNPIKSAIQKVSEKLHNTVSVCKKNYIDPEIIQAVDKKIKNDI